MEKGGAISHGAMVMTMFDRKGFDPPTLDGTISLLGQIYQAAIGAAPR